jgi:hypothetical protein
VDCLANARDVIAPWGEQGMLTYPRRRAAAEVLAGVAMATAAKDSDVFDQAIKVLREVSPGYLPSSPPIRSLLSRFIGYPRAERLLGMVRRLLH